MLWARGPREVMSEMQSSGVAAVSVEPMEIAGDAGEGRRNALAGAASAYLRSAMHQPVEWMEWGEAAFERAAREDKPILLDIGAVWCHWCHVMDRESYEDAETARIINEHFVAVKVDRDERPDVDTRYQAAVSAISGQGGWPLTAFLTPEGRPYFGGTYFPPEDGYGRPSFQRVLLTMAEAFAERRTEVDETAASVMNAIEHNEAFSGRAGGAIKEIGRELVEKMAMSALKSADLKHGGFGGQPKFPYSSALDLLIEVASRTDFGLQATGTSKLSGLGTAKMAEAAKQAVLVTLEKMAKGGIHDHLAGGFHRYSVDEHWVVPHFEKMAYDNSELLKNYVHAYQAFGDAEYARVARDVMRWMDEWLSDREQGGFHASQDADCSLDDDGDYYTWTLDEAAEALTAEEQAVVAGYYNIGEIGDMQHNVAKNVLHVQAWAGCGCAQGRSEGGGGAIVAGVGQAEDAMRHGGSVLTPYVDKTMYVAWNAMCISAYLEAGRVLDEPKAQAFALKSLDRVLGAAWGGRAIGLAHVVVYGEPGVKAERVAGGLDDYVFLGHAALDAWESTSEMRYYEAAVELMESALERFYDAKGGGFFDTEKSGGRETQPGRVGSAAQAIAGLADAGGKPRGGDAADAIAGAERERGVCGQGEGDSGGVRRGGGALRPVRGDVCPGAAADGDAADAGVRDRGGRGGARVGGGGRGAIFVKQERGAPEARTACGAIGGDAAPGAGADIAASAQGARQFCGGVQRA